MRGGLTVNEGYPICHTMRSKVSYWPRAADMLVDARATLGLCHLDIEVLVSMDGRGGGVIAVDSLGISPSATSLTSSQHRRILELLFYQVASIQDAQHT